MLPNKFRWSGMRSNLQFINDRLKILMTNSGQKIYYFGSFKIVFWIFFRWTMRWFWLWLGKPLWLWHVWTKTTIWSWRISFGGSIINIYKNQCHRSLQWTAQLRRYSSVSILRVGLHRQNRSLMVNESWTDVDGQILLRSDSKVIFKTRFFPIQWHARDNRFTGALSAVRYRLRPTRRHAYTHL